MFGLSTDSFSSAYTEPFTASLFSKLMPGFEALSIETADLLIRKAAHLSEYFIFGILVAYASTRASQLGKAQSVHANSSPIRTEKLRRKSRS